MRALELVNRALRPLGLVVRSVDEEQRAAVRECDESLLLWRRAAAHRAEAVRLRKEVERLRHHLLELDELLGGVGHSVASKACRRVVDVALGRDVERAA